jgi:hypothetical protein
MQYGWYLCNPNIVRFLKYHEVSVFLVDILRTYHQIA